MMEFSEIDRRIPNETLNIIRGILVKSLSRENISETDLRLSQHRQRSYQSYAANKDGLESSRSASGSRGNLSALHKEREERIKQLKEQQNEQRQRKLEELKAQALAAQKFREQKEEERRKRMEELRNRENDRRHQVEERKRQIWEAERERREYILRKNLERDARLENKRKQERGQIIYAFGSSTPRLIETVDCSGMGMSASFWATRRSTSITNVALNNSNNTLTRRSSERELGETKKRATSASGLDRQSEDESGGDQGGYSRANRRKTDLMPTIPSPRDSSRNSFGTHTPRTPARASSMTRLDQLAQPVRRNGEHIRAIIERERQQALELENLSRNLSESSRLKSPSPATQRRKSRSMSQLVAKRGGDGGSKVRSSSSAPRRSAASAKTLKKNDSTSKSMSQLTTTTVDSKSSTRASISRSERLRHQVKEQLSNSGVASGLRSGEITPNSSYSRPGSAMSSSTTASGVVYRRSTPSARKPRPASIAITGVTPGAAPPGADGAEGGKRPPLPRQSTTSSRKSSASNTPKEPKTARTPGTVTPKSGTPVAIVSPDSGIKSLERSIKAKAKAPVPEPEVVAKTPVPAVPEKKEPEKVVEETSEVQEQQEEADESVVEAPSGEEENEMTASMIAKSKITTEEEAKAALAERRRLAREEAERQAELERQRIAAEAEAERQKQLEEEERLRKLEEETNRLADEAARLEQERLQQAIAETKKREEEERQKREEEQKQKAEKEEQERKAREEAEKQRIEMQEKLEVEKKEREERRKRIDAIMSRTRKTGSAANTPQKSADGGDQMTQSQIAMSQSMTDSMIQEVKAASDNKELNKIESFLENEKMENEKENSVNNGASSGNAPTEQIQIQSDNSDSSTPTTTIATTRIESDLLIEDSIQHTNGHGNGTLEDKLKKPVESTKIGNSNLITDQLIDLNNFTSSEVQIASNNFINNNNNTTPLVASDSQDNRDLSLL